MKEIPGTKSREGLDYTSPREDTGICLLAMAFVLGNTLLVLGNTLAIK